jgi:hypothetical protein
VSFEESAGAKAPSADSAAKWRGTPRQRAQALRAAARTGHGRNETSHARYVQFERESEVPSEVVTLRYDSSANLIALGVIPSPRPAPRYQPDPFPAAFVPDPPARW